MTKAAEGDVLETLTPAVGRYGEGMKLLLLGLLLLVPGALAFFFLLCKVAIHTWSI